MSDNEFNDPLGSRHTAEYWKKQYALWNENAMHMMRQRDEARQCAESYRDDQKRTYTAAGGEWHDAAHKLPWENGELNHE